MFSNFDLTSILLSLPGILLAITFHEMAHGYAANAMGDDTARLAGRLSPNPLKHLDPIGFVSMLLFHFGWAKPVPINPNNFKNRRKGIIVVSLAGCLTNLLLGFISLTVLYLYDRIAPVPNGILIMILQYIYIYNIYFAIFNLLPIPPLDGSHVLAEFLPMNAKAKYEDFGRYGMILLIALMFLGIFERTIDPISSMVHNLFQTILGLLFGFLR